MTWPGLAKNQALNEFVRARLTFGILLVPHLLSEVVQGVPGLLQSLSATGHGLGTPFSPL